MTGTPIGDAIERDLHHVAETMRHLMHHGAPQPAAAATLHNETSTATREETPMSFIDDFEAHAQAAAEHSAAALQGLQQVDRAALDKFTAVTANPATNAIVEQLAAIAHLPLTNGELSTAENVLRMTLAMVGGQVQPQPAQ